MAASDIGAERMAALFRNKFCNPCPVHHNVRHNPCNYFCLDCQGLQQEALCLYCRMDHESHRILQVRKASLSEVVRAADLKGLIDITGIQLYVINNSKVVHLSKRSRVGYYSLQGIKRRCQRIACMVCSYILKDDDSFCSVQCKVEYEARRTAEGTEACSRYRSLKELHNPQAARKKEPAQARWSLHVQEAALHNSSLKKKELLSTRSGSRRKGRPVRAPFQ